MEKYFRTKEGELVNVIEHTLEQFMLYPNLKIYIGTDSQTDGAFTNYASVVVYRYGNNGAHYVFQQEKVPKIKDTFLRLYNEGTKTVDISEIFRAELPSVNIEQLEFDFAAVAKTISTPLVGVFKGYLRATFKGGEMIAARAADHICRNWRAHEKLIKEDKSKINLRVA